MRFKIKETKILPITHYRLTEKHAGTIFNNGLVSFGKAARAKRPKVFSNNSDKNMVAKNIQTMQMIIKSEGS